MRAMKDSSIPWIGEIPEGWGIDTIGNLYTLRTEKVSDKDYAPLSVTKMGIVPQLETAAKTDDGDNRKLVRVGDFAINSRSDRRGSCGISAYDGSVSLINIVLTPRGQMYPHFYNWLFHTELFADEFYKWGHGIVDDLWTTRWQEMKRISIVSPSYQEQQRIAEFLDRTCAEVDEMIALQEQIIEELKAYKQSVITEAVTKGLNPAAPMRDSGIEWIGSIPEHWEVCKLKRKYRLLNGRAYSDNELLSEGRYRILRVGNLFTSNHWYYSDLELEDNKYCEKGDLLYGWSASIGPYMWEEEKVIYHYHIWKVLFALNSRRYVYYQLQALTDAKKKDMHGTAMQHLTMDNMNNSYIATAPLSEQQAIADYLDEKCADIDSLIQTKLSKIDNLKEYKKSIIYEYVTGKKQI